MKTRPARLAAALLILAACRDGGSSPDPVGPDGPYEVRAAAAADAGLPMHAEMEFGTDAGRLGSSFPPASHDRSFHAFDRLRPTSVTIAAGGSVTFEIYGVHQPAVYEPGVRPEDIDTESTEPIQIGAVTLPFPLVRIVDTEGRIALGPPQSFAEQEWTLTFPEPGRYLVICTTWAHFTEANMYGWVIVQ